MYMKKVFIKLIELYQVTPLHCHSWCRYVPTCSQYTKEAIERYGSVKGVWLGMKRICRCNPWGGSGIDLVPEKKLNNKK